jgi:hypothetical protein
MLGRGGRMIFKSWLVGAERDFGEMRWEAIGLIIWTLIAFSLEYVIGCWRGAFWQYCISPNIPLYTVVSAAFTSLLLLELGSSQ